MSSVKLPEGKHPQDAGGALVARSFFRLLASFLIVDAVVMLCFDVALWQWGVLSGVEALLLLFHTWRSDRAVRQVMSPLTSLTEAAESLKDSSLDANELRRLARKLERVDAGRMTDGVAIASGGKELAALTASINDMLARIDARYQAQVRFTSDASHELRTPISVIQGYANLLDRWGKDDPATRQEAITAIRQEADSMAQLVEQLLFLVRGDNETQKFNPAQVDLTELVTSVAKETAMVAPTHTVSSEVESGVTAVADPALVKECLRVLSENAVKYTPAGGSVTIGLKRAPEGFAHIWVSDTGVGISQADLPHIFDRFFRADTSRSTEGTGLGLSIAAWIAARHKGRIDVTSRPGVGSRFVFVLPLTPPTEEEEEAL